ncbi:TrkA family potassium uptake protein [Romboutsia ilealis]|uniref:TrkA family potassium uptake protein n=1 Tax=Romboutsia faecis TaxID=2764597 RepID=A0ABR7JR76_9FIRM|nr:TrkA family potassium uptake protein [Romboutsia faecis]MBC5997423.1 TrkA family potassium uptake protein [Romboutsia faecis]MRN24944.1 TrkA family potassium uptake protein [Romboutsia ilealis]
MKKFNSEYVIIAGCSRFGTNIATELSLSGKDVVIIDINENSFRKLSPNYSGFKMIGDATDIDILMENGIDRATMLVAATNDDDVNIMISLIAKNILNVNTVITRLYDNEKEVVYDGLDIKIIRPTTLTINEFDKLLEMNNNSDRDKEFMNIKKANNKKSLIRRVGAY